MLQLHKNQNYYFRYSVPKEFQPLFRSKEILRSLKTKDKLRAEVLYADNLKEIEYIFYILRSNMLTENEIENIIDTYKKGAVAKTNKLFSRLPDIQELTKIIDFEEQKNVLKNMFVDGNFNRALLFKESGLAEYGVTNDDLDAYRTSKSVSDITKELLDSLNIVDYSEDDFIMVAEEVAATKIGLLDYLESLLKGDITLDDPYGMDKYITKGIGNVVTTVKSLEEPKETYKQTGITIEQAWEMFVRNKKEIRNVGNSSIKAYESAKKYLEIFYPKETDIGFFSKAIFEELIFKFIKLPVQSFNKKSYMAMDYEELSSLPDDVMRLNNKTINGKFVNYRDLFKFLEKKGHVDFNPVNVDSLYTEPADKEPYSEENITTILNSNIDENIKKYCLIALYSGMRIGEICLFKKTGISEENGIRYFDIKKGETQTKTENAIRKIPIHKKIESLVDSFMSSAETDFLFVNPTKDRTDFNTEEAYEDNIKKMFSKRVNGSLNKVIVSKKKTFHSFRKNFAVELYRRSNTQEAFIKYLMGHSIAQNITLSTYGQVHLESLDEMIQKIEYNI